MTSGLMRETRRVTYASIYTPYTGYILSPFDEVSVVNTDRTHANIIIAMGKILCIYIACVTVYFLISFPE